MATHARRIGLFALAAAAAVGAACGVSPRALAQPAPPAEKAPDKAPDAPKDKQPTLEELYPLNIVEILRMQAGRLLPLTRTADAQRFLISTSWLNIPVRRTVWRNATTGEAISGREYEARPEAQRAGFEKREYSEKDYYFTRYGSPLAYVRAVDLIASNLPPSIPENARFRHKKVLDYGFGSIGQLRLIAALGNDVVGVETDPVLHALYSDPTDQGVVPGSPIMDDPCPDGSLLLLFGHFPADDNIVRSVGDRYDVIMSKNTLKNGYINPEHEVDKRMLVDLGVPKEKFLEEVFKRLNPGGLFLMYNLSPAQSKDPAKWIPWADGRSPFTKDMLEKAGFEVLAFDTDDTELARRMAYALKWNEKPDAMDVDHDLFGMYTLCKRPSTQGLK